MTIGPIAFLSPWLLAGLLALPIIYWLLRTVPPSPTRLSFPPTRILMGIVNREKTPAKTPWWLMLIRLAAAALVIFALADPVLNPNKEKALAGSGPVAIVVDNGVAKQVFVEEELNRYVVALLRHTRSDSRLYVGASPRSGIALLRVAKARALAEGRDFLLPDDVKAVAEHVLAHRLVLAPEARSAGMSGAELVRDAIARTPVPV